jgi:hypothetical protein
MKINSILILFSLALIAMTSCASQKSAAYTYDNGNGRSFQNSQADVVTEKKIIYSSSIDLTVKIPDTAAVYISGIATKYKGYVQQTGTTMCVIRVEAKYLKTAMDEIALLGKVSNKTSYGEDVSDQYADYAIRLENAEKARMRYLELLARDENVQATLLVEKELERLNETIELMKGQMNRIDHLSTYSTITVYLKEKTKPGVIGYIGIGVYKAVKWLFVRN